MSFKYRLEELLFKKIVGFKSRIRILFFKLLGMQLGSNNRFEYGRCRRLTQIRIGNNNAFTKGFVIWPLDRVYNDIRIEIGDNNYFNRNLMLDACGKISIGDGNMFGPDVYVTDSNHKFGFGKSSKDLPMDIGKVIIGNNCWIGAKAIILKDVILGDNCIVGAGAVVTHSFPPGSVLAGVPAKLIKSIT
jgi:maltose O-acetyltransferase